MSIAYWIVAGLLALLYLAVGLMKVARSREQLQASGMGWVESTPSTGVKLIGILEVLGAVGLVLPPLVNILPVLTVAAAVGLALLQVGAIIVHVRRREYRNLPVNVVLLVLAAVLVPLAASAS